jgi:hypothetical protein
MPDDLHDRIDHDRDLDRDLERGEEQFSRRERAAVYRVPRQRGMDAATQRLALIAGVLAVALLGVIGAWSLSSHRSGGVSVPVVRADPSPIRVKPENAGGMQITGQNEAVLSGDGGGDGDANDHLAPPPEMPAPAQLHALEASEHPPAPAPVPVPAPVPAPTATAPTPAPVVPPPSENAEARLAAHEAPPPPLRSGIEVQLAAMDSEDLAHAEWARLDHKMPDVLRGRAPLIARFERDGHEYWRLRTGYFATIADAAKFCDDMKAKGAACDPLRH